LPLWDELKEVGESREREGRVEGGGEIKKGNQFDREEILERRE